MCFEASLAFFDAIQGILQALVVFGGVQNSSAFLRGWVFDSVSYSVLNGSEVGVDFGENRLRNGCFLAVKVELVQFSLDVAEFVQ